MVDTGKFDVLCLTSLYHSSTPMKPANRRTLLQIAAVLALVLVCLVFRRVFYFFELATLELRYFWWLILIFAGGLWLLSLIGKIDK